MKNGKMKELSYSEEGNLKFESILYVPNVGELKWEIMKEAHYSAYAMHLGSIKVYRMLKENYGWKGIKGDIAELLVEKNEGWYSWICVKIFFSVGKGGA